MSTRSPGYRGVLFLVICSQFHVCVSWFVPIKFGAPEGWSRARQPSRER